LTKFILVDNLGHSAVQNAVREKYMYNKIRSELIDFFFLIKTLCLLESSFIWIENGN